MDSTEAATPGFAEGPLLRVSELSRSFGGVFAVSNVGMVVRRGELRAVIGPNGAGKSTLFNLITGFLRPDSGTVEFDGRRIDRLSPHQRAALKISIVFQAAHLFSGMTVLENVMVGAHSWTKSGFLTAAFRLPRHGREERRVRAASYEALERAGIARWAHTPAGLLPFGTQRSLQVARSLCSAPDLLLLDEPASGLRPEERESLAVLLETLKGQGLTTVLVEHDVPFVSRLADRVSVLDLGRLIAEGPPDEVLQNPQVVAAYLGKAADNALRP